MTAIELFCGVGGMGLGFEQAGYDVLATVDIDPVHLAAHRRNFPLCEQICEDVTTPQRTALVGVGSTPPEDSLRRSVDCLFGGPSCQGFSVIGRRDPQDPRNELIAEFARVVASIRPRWFVLENVPGLLSCRYEPVLDDLRRRVRAVGYSVAVPWVLNAGDHGVPQDRRRVFVVGARAQHSLPSVPAHQEGPVCVAEAIDDLSFLGRFRRLHAVDRLVTRVMAEGDGAAAGRLRAAAQRG